MKSIPKRLHGLESKSLEEGPHLMSLLAIEVRRIQNLATPTQRGSPEMDEQTPWFTYHLSPYMHTYVYN